MRKHISCLIALSTLFSVAIASAQDPDSVVQRVRRDLQARQQGNRGVQQQAIREPYTSNRPLRRLWAQDRSFSVELPVDYDPLGTTSALFVAQNKRGEGFYFIKSEHVVPGVDPGPIPPILLPALQASVSPYRSPVDVIRIMLPQTRLPEGSIDDVSILRVDPFDAPRTGGFGPQSEVAVVHFQCTVSSTRIQGAAVVQTIPPAVMGVWYLTMILVTGPAESFDSNWPTYRQIMVSLSSGEGSPVAPVPTPPPGLRRSTPSSGSDADSPYPPGMGRRTDTFGGRLVFRDPEDPQYGATYPLAAAPSNASWWRCNEESGVTVWTGSGSPGISCRQVFPRN